MANFEMVEISQTRDDNRPLHFTEEQEIDGNGAIRQNNAAEGSPLLSAQVSVSNRSQQPLVNVPNVHHSSSLINEQTSTQAQTSTLRKLNENVCRGVRLWMVLLFIFLFILTSILVSMALCTVIHEDVDEKYDPASFVVPLYFNGSLQLPFQTYSAELLSSMSNQSQTLSTELQKKLSDLYNSSPALGRYFSRAEIQAFRNGSVVAQYRLMFLMPKQHDELNHFILSREMVYNVLRQHLYDQEPEELGRLYIDPATLEMEVSVG